MPRQFAPEFRQRALRMLEEALPEHETEYAAIRHVATKLGIGPETLRKWRRKSEIDSGHRPGVTSAEQAEIKQLKREIAELKRANEILKTASAFFAAELDRPTTR
jgi:transposase